MQKPEDLRYTREHEWVRLEDDIAVVGITDHAQDALGDIVYVELPDVGDALDQEEVFGVVESVKTTSDLYTPVAGTVLEVNESLVDAPGTVNEDCYGEGWMIKLRIKDAADFDKLMSFQEYEKFLQEEDND